MIEKLKNINKEVELNLKKLQKEHSSKEAILKDLQQTAKTP